MIWRLYTVKYTYTSYRMLRVKILFGTYSIVSWMIIDFERLYHRHINIYLYVYGLYYNNIIRERVCCIYALNKLGRVTWRRIPISQKRFSTPFVITKYLVNFIQTKKIKNYERGTYIIIEEWSNTNIIIQYNITLCIESATHYT